jgi:hypothetical protein
MPALDATSISLSPEFASVRVDSGWKVTVTLPINISVWRNLACFAHKDARRIMEKVSGRTSTCTMLIYSGFPANLQGFLKNMVI